MDNNDLVGHNESSAKLGMWDERYSSEEFVYGQEPNIFFAEQLLKIKPGKLLLPCEGEGRNAVFAAKNKWEANAFDTSKQGKVKAEKLSRMNAVSINYELRDAMMADYPENSFDAIAFVYAHFPVHSRKKIHQKAVKWLKPGGILIIEAFTPDQLENQSGGPKDPTMLYTEAILKEDFEGLKINVLNTLEINLNEGEYHQGIANVIRLVCTK